MMYGVAAVLLVLCILLASPLRASALTAKEEKEAKTKGWHELSTGKYTYTVKRTVQALGFTKIGDFWYHFDEEGYLSLGWIKENGKLYYAQKVGNLGKRLGALKSGFKEIDGKYYQFDDRDVAGKFGRLQTGWVMAGEDVYYYSKDGEKAVGLKTINGRIYYFRKSSNAVRRGLVFTGWKVISGKRYYFRDKGEIGKLYGAAYTNKTVKIEGVEYTFGKDGAVKASKATTKEAKFIEKIGPLAQKDMAKTGVLASITIGQACLESAYGTSELATKAKNYFGMKAALSNGNWKSNWKGKTYKKNTQEYKNGKWITIKDTFRKYSSMAASVADHSAYLTGAKISGSTLRYKGLKGCKNYKKAARIIKKGGYATAPNYVSVLCGIIEKYDLTRFDS